MLERSSHFEGSPVQFALMLARHSKCPMGKHILKLESCTTQNIIAKAMRELAEGIQAATTSTKRLMYASINPEFNLIPVYTRSLVVPEYHRRAYTRLRLSSHRLRIETGRWSRTPREERMCPCSQGVQTEEHALCDCPITQGIRSSNEEIDFSNLISFCSKVAQLSGST